MTINTTTSRRRTDQQPHGMGSSKDVAARGLTTGKAGMNPRRLVHWLRAEWRMVGGYCPECNGKRAEQRCVICADHPTNDTPEYLFPPPTVFVKRWRAAYAARVAERAAPPLGWKGRMIVVTVTWLIATCLIGSFASGLRVWGGLFG